MSVCDRCIKAIQELRPQGFRGPQKNIRVRLPKFSRAAVLDCWICSQFKRWLETEKHDVFKSWRKKSLLVEFGIIARIEFVTPPKENVIPPLLIQIHPSNQEIGVCVCEIELNFISFQNFYVVKFP